MAGSAGGTGEDVDEVLTRTAIKALIDEGRASLRGELKEELDKSAEALDNSERKAFRLEKVISRLEKVISGQASLIADLWDDDKYDAAVSAQLEKQLAIEQARAQAKSTTGGRAPPRPPRKRLPNARKTG